MNDQELTPLEVAQQVYEAALAVSSPASGLFRKATLLMDSQAAIARAKSDRKVDCKAGCCYCCSEVILVGLPELAAIAEAISGFSEARRESMRLRLSEYEADIRPVRDKPLTLARAKCPLLENDLCSVYGDRPIACRARNSLDVGYCKASEVDPSEVSITPRLNSQLAVYQAGRSGMDKALAEKATLERFELGRSISAILANPDNYQTGLVPVPRTQPPLKFNYPPGVEVSPPSPEAMQLLNDGDFAKADRLLDDRNVLHLFAKLKLPAMHASNEQIAESRVRFADALNKIGELKFDPRAGVAGLVSRQSYDLAYQGLSVRALLERQGEVFAKIAASATPGLVEPLRSNRKPGKTRIGYISNNMRFSNGCRWSLGWLANHGEEFESYAFNTGPQEDVVSQQFKATADHYYRITGGYAEAAKFIRALDLDIMIFTDIGLVVGDYAFATLRLARIQCTAWGHPVTSGLPTIDYYLSSELMEPEGAESEYSENLVRLPNSGLYIKRPAYDVPKATREQLGLPEGFLPFMSQAILKWIPNRDEVLARIYERLQAPLVFVGSAYAAGDAKFSARLDKLGIKSRILPRTHPQQFNRYVQAADVCFDPPDWSGGNTTIEALWAGVPVVTWPGLYMRGRHSLAFNEIAGISELNATSEADFVGHIFDRDLHAEAMKKCNRDSLFEDKVASNGLNNFLLNVVRV